MTEKKPIKTLRLNRETVKRLAVRTSVRTGAAAVSTYLQWSVQSGSLARSGGLSKDLSDSAAISGGIDSSG